jgi:hypothetical protein
MNHTVPKTSPPTTWFHAERRRGLEKKMKKIKIYVLEKMYRTSFHCYCYPSQHCIHNLWSIWRYEVVICFIGGVLRCRTSPPLPTTTTKVEGVSYLPLLTKGVLGDHGRPFVYRCQILEEQGGMKQTSSYGCSPMNHG